MTMVPSEISQPIWRVKKTNSRHHQEEVEDMEEVVVEGMGDLKEVVTEEVEEDMGDLKEGDPVTRK